MQEHIKTIKSVYADFYNFLLKKGQFAVKDTKIGFWGATPTNDILELFENIDLKKYNSILDLGSGDGKVVMLASLFTNATGIEFDSWLIEVSNSIKSKLAHIPETRNASFLKKDFMEHSIKDYSAVFCSPDKPFERGLEKKLESELTGDLIVFGHHFHPQNLNEKERFTIGGTRASIYSKK